jgi:serine phosphatase RsbU (regulator of sigma subunit)
MTQAPAISGDAHRALPSLSLSQPRVLLVDDDDAIARLLASVFTGRGMDIKRARSGPESLGLILQWHPDIVFLDVELPGLSGLDVLAFVRQRQLDTAVVMMTGLGSEQVAIDALRLGANDYLRKPFDLTDCETVLGRTLARIRLERQNAALSSRLDEHRQQLDRELARAAQMQAELLPAALPDIPGLDVAAGCRPAHEVGGDFYDWQLLSGDRVSLTIGDVMGKGVSAALLMATVRAVLRALAVENPPGRAVQRAARALDADLTRSGSFITLFHAQYDTRSGRLRYVDAGHGYVVMRRKNGALEPLLPWSLPLGVDLSETYREGSTVLEPGDTLVLYSDGLAEARPDLFGDTSSIAGQVAEHPGAADLVSHLMARATETTPLPDDLTVMVMRRSDIELVEPPRADRARRGRRAAASALYCGNQAPAA